MGLSLESVVGYLDDTGAITGQDGAADGADAGDGIGVGVSTVPEAYLEGLLQVSDERFHENTRRIERFRSLLRRGVQVASVEHVRRNKGGEEWEDAVVRRERMRAEGLRRAEVLKVKMEMEMREKSDGGLVGGEGGNVDVDVDVGLSGYMDVDVGLNGDTDADVVKVPGRDENNAAVGALL
jgi:hypothetical protein